jgi:Flp pilus assembly protein TadG
MRRRFPRLPGTRRPTDNPRRSGQSIVELAIVVPVLILMAVGVFEFGRALHAYVTVTHAARDGARIAMTASASDAKIKKHVQDGAQPLTIPDGNITINRGGGQATVKVKYGFTTPVPLISEFWGGGTLDISRTMISKES